MKKLFSILITISLIFCLCACDRPTPLKDSQKPESKNSFDEAFLAGYNGTMQNVQAKESSMIAPAQKDADGLYGYIDVFGNWVIEPQFVAAAPFSGDYAVILDEYNEYCIINRSGETVLTSYQKSSINQSAVFSEGLIALRLDTDNAQSYVYLDTDFQNPFTAKIISGVRGRSYTSQVYFGLATPFRNGVALVMKLKNSDIKDSKASESAYVINKSGEILATLPEGLDPDEYGFDDNGNVIVKTLNNLYGLCDKNGNLIVECIYRKMQHCEGNLYLVCNDSGFFGYIDQSGNKVIDFKYQKALPFSEGLAAVFNGTAWGLVDEQGNTVSDFLFEEIALLKSANVLSSTNKAAVSGGVLGVLREGRWMLLSKEGKQLVNIAQTSYNSFSGIAFKSVDNGYVVFVGNNGNGDGFGVLDTDGNLLLSPSFASIGLFR